MFRDFAEKSCKTNGRPCVSNAWSAVCDAGDYAWSRAGIRDSAALVREPAQAFEAFHAFVKPWHADHEHVAERFVAAWLRVEQFEIGSLAGQCGSKRQIVGLEEIVAAG